jgi:GMP synthase-like glutamine amidotransferase
MEAVKKMRAHYLQHVPFEGLGSIAGWLEKAGYGITHTRFFESPALPDPETIDLLVVMGGPMSVNDESEFPWLVSEKRFIREIIDSGKPVLGICLGAQLIAGALGAKVFPNRVKEIGWHPIRGVDATDPSVFSFPQAMTVFHWHGETFDLPGAAAHLATSDGCVNQAFQLGRCVMGLQFHLETTPESARALVANCRSELVPSPYVQSEEEILAAGAEVYASIHGLMDRVLYHIAGQRKT